MSEQVMPFVGGPPDYLSLVNAEVEKVEPTIKVSLTPPDKQPPSLVSSESYYQGFAYFSGRTTAIPCAS